VAKRIIIPVRLASTRLPNKPMLDIAGKPMIQWVYEQAISCKLDSVLIATDDVSIKKAAEGFGADVCMTSADHTSGTDRIAEAAMIANYADDDLIVNLQGDEPLIPVENVLQVAANLAAHPDAAMSTLCERIHDKAEIFNENCVKVVLDKNDYALYFSRASIPWSRGHFPSEVPETIRCYRHIGMYAYRGKFLRQYAQLAPSPLEQWEALEQLRVLWHGEKIHVGIAKSVTAAGVDTLEDLERVRRFFIANS
jgi:3-deoxy-manno-octulosonate cytidylyltransferase (CMP-KDO synthetase)